MLIQVQKKSFRFDKKVFLGGTLNLDISSKFGEILREFGEILGKYGMLDVKSVASKGIYIHIIYMYINKYRCVRINPSGGSQ